jgi:hypothetical protein
LGGLSHARATARAGRLFEELSLDQHNVFTWTAVVLCHVRNVENDRAIELFVIDEDINTLTTIILFIEIVDPIIRSQAQQLNYQVNSLLCSSTYNIESRLLPNNLIVLRNQ